MSQIYKIRRDEICVGKVITDFEILKNGRNLLGEKKDFARYTLCRSMLFTEIDSDFGKYAQDLLYDSPLYPIFGKAEDIAYTANMFLVKDAENIGKLLEYYGIKPEVDYEDVKRIRREYFNGSFPIEHSYDFGLIESDLKSLVFYDGKGNLVSDPKIIKECQRRIKIQEMLGLRSDFITDPEIIELCREFGGSVLDPKFFEILKSNGDKGLFEVLYGYEERMNAFKPHKAEGPIRTLKKHLSNT